jgi:hypothetical protein
MVALHEDDSYLTVEQKKKIDIVLEAWKGKKDCKFSENEEKLFWILCEYDHAHAPSNWEGDQKHANVIADWTKWFKEEKPEEINPILLLRVQTGNRNEELAQWGEISNHIFSFMIDYFC